MSPHVSVRVRSRQACSLTLFTRGEVDALLCGLVLRVVHKHEGDPLEKVQGVVLAALSGGCFESFIVRWLFLLGLSRARTATII